MKKLLIVLLIISLLLAGCSAPAENTESPAEAPAPAENTEAPAEAAEPTPAPTAEPTPMPTPEPELNIVEASIVYNDTLDYKTSSATVTVTFTDGSQQTDVITGNCYSEPRIKDEIYIADLDMDGINELIVNVGVTGSTYGAADTVIYDTAEGVLTRVLSTEVGPSIDSYNYGGGASAEIIEDVPYIDFTAGMNLGESTLSYHGEVWAIVK